MGEVRFFIFYQSSVSRKWRKGHDGLLHYTCVCSVFHGLKLHLFTFWPASRSSSSTPRHKPQKVFQNPNKFQFWENSAQSALRSATRTIWEQKTSFYSVRSGNRVKMIVQQWKCAKFGFIFFINFRSVENGEKDVMGYCITPVCAQFFTDWSCICLLFDPLRDQVRTPPGTRFTTKFSQLKIAQF